MSEQQECIDLSPLAAQRLLFLQTRARLAPRQPSFRWPSTSVLFVIQDELVKDLGLTDEKEGGSGDDAYNCVFLKELIGRLEGYLESHPNDEEIEINGDLLAAYALLKASSSFSSSNPAPRQVTHFYPSSSIGQHSDLLPGWKSIQTKEESTTISRGTTGLKTWEACLRLTGHLIAHPELLQGGNSNATTILELGCGLGFLGIVAHNLCSHRLILTDLDGEVLENARMAVEENCRDNPHQIEVHPLDWIDVQKGELQVCDWLQNDARPDIVLAADIVFEPKLLDPLCSVLAKVLIRPDNHPFALIASTVRNPSTFQQFLKTLDSYGLMADEIKIAKPDINLETLNIVNTHDSISSLPLFPSTHNPSRDGHVTLLRISAETHSVQ